MKPKLPFDVVMRVSGGGLFLLTEETVRQDMPSVTIAEMRVLHRAHAIVPPDHVAAILRVKRILGGQIVGAAIIRTMGAEMAKSENQT